jgi:hypothetical protein
MNKYHSDMVKFIGDRIKGADVWSSSAPPSSTFLCFLTPHRLTLVRVLFIADLDTPISEEVRRLPSQIQPR